MQQEIMESERMTSASRSRDTGAAKHRPCGTSSGFSLIELLVVMAVILVVAGFTMPQMLQTLDTFRIRGSLSDASGLTQRCRIQAIKLNNTERMRVILSNGRVVLYYKPWNAAVPGLQATDPQLPLSTRFAIPGLPTAPVPPLTGLTMWGSNIAVPPANINSDMYFNSRGMPCVPAGAVCTPTNGFVTYFRYSSNGTFRWVALSISPAGRMQNWFWNGNGWGN